MEIKLYDINKFFRLKPIEKNHKFPEIFIVLK